MPKRIDVQEWMDLPSQPMTDLSASLRDLQKVNRFLGGIAVTRSHLRRLFKSQPKDVPLTLLDLATGSGDIPCSILRWGKRNGYQLHYTCLDVNPSILEAAERENRDVSEIEFVQGDARHVPFEAGSFDYVTCSTALHHFAPEDAVQILREMDRLSRKGWVLNDLRRSRWGWLGIWLLTHLLPANRLTRHDGPVSTLRAYTPEELRDLSERTDLRGYELASHPFCRMALVMDKAETSPPCV